MAAGPGGAVYQLAAVHGTKGETMTRHTLALIALTMSLHGQTATPRCTTPNVGAQCDPATQQKDSLSVWKMSNRQHPILTLYDSGRVEIHAASGAKLMDCEGINGRPTQCVLAPGHTLDEVMQVWAASLKVRK